MTSQNQREPSAESLLRLAERADLLDDPDVQQLVVAGAVTENTPLRRQIEQVLAGKAGHQKAYPFDGRPQQPPISGDTLSLGVTVTGSDYVLPLDDLTKHLLAVGQSGAGKTTLFYNLMEQVSAPFWAFDLRQDYRHLLQHEDINLQVLPWTEFKFNGSIESLDCVGVGR